MKCHSSVHHQIKHATLEIRKITIRIAAYAKEVDLERKDGYLGTI